MSNHLGFGILNERIKQVGVLEQQIRELTFRFMARVVDVPRRLEHSQINLMDSVRDFAGVLGQAGLINTGDLLPFLVLLPQMRLLAAEWRGFISSHTISLRALSACFRKTSGAGMSSSPPARCPLRSDSCADVPSQALGTSAQNPVEAVAGSPCSRTSDPGLLP